MKIEWVTIAISNAPKILFSRISREHLHALAISIGFTALVCFITIHLLHNSFNTYALDLGLFTQTLKYSLEGKLLYTTIDQASYFADHFSPILLLLVPIYWLFPNAVTLLVVQAVAAGASVYFVYLLTRSFKFSHRTGILFQILFCLNPLLWGLLLFDFHPEVLAIPALLYMFYGMINKNDLAIYTGFFIALLTKETIIVILGILGFYRLVEHYIKEKTINRQALFIFGTSIAFYSFAIFTAYAASSWEMPKMLQYSSYRYSYIELPLLQAVSAYFENLLNRNTIFMVAAYLAPFGLLPLGSLRWAAPGLFILLINISSTYPGQNSIFYQYAAPALPFLFTAFLASLQSLKAKQQLVVQLTRVTPRIATYGIIALMVISVSYTTSAATRIHLLEVPNEHDQNVKQVISHIPDNVTVTAQKRVFPHIAHRTEVYIPKPGNPYGVYSDDIIWGYPERLTEYVVVDWSKREFYTGGKFWETAISTIIQQDYDSVLIIDVVELFELKREN